MNLPFTDENLKTVADFAAAQAPRSTRPSPT